MAKSGQQDRARKLDSVTNKNTIATTADIGLTRKQVHETQAQCRLADEYDAAQERGEVGQRTGRPKKVVPKENDFSSPPTVTDIGLTRKQVHEAEQTSRTVFLIRTPLPRSPTLNRGFVVLRNRTEFRINPKTRPSPPHQNQNRPPRRRSLRNRRSG